MLKKLLKYDFKWVCNKALIFFAIVCLFTAITSRILGYYTSSFIGNLFYMIFRNAYIGLAVGLIFNLILRTWFRVRNNLYKDESYLTHTLPVSKNSLFNSKIITSIVLSIISILIILIGILIIFLDNNLINTLKEFMNNSDIVFIAVSIFITLILELIYLIISAIVGVIIGNRHNNYKDALSIVYGIAIYMFFQLLMLGLIYVFGLFNNDVLILFQENIKVEENIPLFKLIISYVNIIYALSIVAVYFIGKKMFNKGVNVE